MWWTSKYVTSRQTNRNANFRPEFKFETLDTLGISVFFRIQCVIFVYDISSTT